MKNIKEEFIETIAAPEQEEILIKTKEEAEELEKQGIEIHRDMPGVDSEFYALYYKKTEYTDEELEMLTKIKLLKSISVIKYCLIFFVILTVINLISSFVVMSNILKFVDMF